MKETGVTGKRRSTTIAPTPDDGNSQRKRKKNSDTINILHLLNAGRTEPLFK